MIYAAVILGILAILAGIYSKITTYFFKRKQGTLIKEDEDLKVKQNKLEQKIEDLSSPVKPQDLSKEEILDFWNKDKK